MNPGCSECGGKLQRNDIGEWFCLTCADAWLRDHLQAKTPHVPAETRALASFRDLMPNRAARRRMRRGR